MLSIREYRSQDWYQVERIYREGIETGLATFETKSKPQKQWERAHVPGTALVAVGEDSLVAGWAVLWPTSDRCVYAGVAEVSVYVGAAARGLGVGKMLLKELISVSEQKSIWTLQAGIFPENTPSIQLHEKCGFRTVGLREKLGALNGVWKDVMLMERRSTVAGL